MFQQGKKYMFFTYRQCIERYHNDYFLERAVANGELRKVEKGVYSDTPSWSELALVAFKNRDAVFTLNSAFYYQVLADSIPDRYYLGTGRNASQIKDKEIRQAFYPEKTLIIGVEEKTINCTTIKLYTKERLLVEIIRHRNKLPFDYYKEIITSYRNRVYDLDEEWFEDNIDRFPGSRKIMTAIRLEVY